MIAPFTYGPLILIVLGFALPCFVHGKKLEMFGDNRLTRKIYYHNIKTDAGPKAYTVGNRFCALGFKPFSLHGMIFKFQLLHDESAKSNMHVSL